MSSVSVFFFCVRERSLKKLIRFLHRINIYVCMPFLLLSDLVWISIFVALNGCASANYCVHLPRNASLFGPPIRIDGTIAIIVGQLTSLINVSRAHGCTLHLKIKLCTIHDSLFLSHSLFLCPFYACFSHYSLLLTSHP